MTKYSIIVWQPIWEGGKVNLRRESQFEKCNAIFSQTIKDDLILLQILSCGQHVATVVIKLDYDALLSASN